MRVAIACAILVGGLSAGLVMARPVGAQPLSPAAAAYLEARQQFDAQLAAYWGSIADKRRIRSAKRRSGEPVQLQDYVLTQPPVYSGPPRPSDAPRTMPDVPAPARKFIPTVPDLLRAAKEEFGFSPDVVSDSEFKRAYARTAAAAGITRDQAVRIYSFETGGNGTYDVQAGLTTPRRPGAQPISPAIGYNQLLNANSVGLLAEHGEHFVDALKKKLVVLNGEAKVRQERKIAAVQRMIAYSRSVPNAWAEHDKLAFTPGGLAIHSLVLDRDLGPLLQLQKLLNSIVFAKRRGYGAPLTAAELAMMNLTGDGNGFDILSIPAALRSQVPTSNFFQQGGYERNSVASRHNVVSALLTATDAKMDWGAKQPGARELAKAFQEIKSP
jgi:hypothetical protein